jgi:hypothetical protein
VLPTFTAQDGLGFPGLTCSGTGKSDLIAPVFFSAVWLRSALSCNHSSVIRCGPVEPVRTTVFHGILCDERHRS